jgi:hypothetical protein
MEAMARLSWVVVPVLLQPDRKARKMGRTNNKARNRVALDFFKRNASVIEIGEIIRARRRLNERHLTGARIGIIAYIKNMLKGQARFLYFGFKTSGKYSPAT